jgi:2-polyprenyl-3-methyl-5-hydroxy-6-metoxy-1,4-benzoquinol methylase
MSGTNEKYGGVATREVPSCYLCGNPGNQLYQDRQDSIFNAPGAWDFRKCSKSSCGLIWMDPVPALEEIGKLYSNYYTHYDDQGAELSRLRKARRFVRDCYFADRFGYVDLVPRLYRPIGRLLYLFPVRRLGLDYDIMRLPASPGGRLLEIGCGSGAFLARMRSLGWNVFGIDPDPAAVAWGQQTHKLDVTCGTWEQMRFPADFFDVITMNHVIEHVHDPVGLLTECQRILRPGGNVVVTTPNADSWGHKMFTGDWRGLEPPRHFMIFSTWNLEECTRRSNLQTLTLRSVSRWARNIFVLSKEIEKQGRQTFPGKIWTRIQGWGFQILENIAEGFSTWSGEEIYFIGQKPHAGR